MGFLVILLAFFKVNGVNDVNKSRKNKNIRDARLFTSIRVENYVGYSKIQLKVCAVLFLTQDTRFFARKTNSFSRSQRFLRKKTCLKWKNRVPACRTELS